MHDVINAFGTIVARGQFIRIPFDSAMRHTNTESGASFVLEFTLDSAGHVHLRQATASRESGLVLSALRGGQQPIVIDRSIDLSTLLRYDHGDIRHPARPGVLSFKHKNINGQYVLSLSWNAGVAVTPRPRAVDSGDFQRARTFTRLLANGTVKRLSPELWYPVFADEDDATAFVRYVSGFGKRMLPDASIRAYAEWSDEDGGYVGEFSCNLPCWGNETGKVVCNNAEDVAGIALENNGGYVLLPLKPYTHTMRTVSGTLYVLFKDGGAFCRSASTGASVCASALYFTRSYDDAARVHATGGKLSVTSVPTAGFVPVYISGNERAVGNVIELKPKGFRHGTAVDSIARA